MTEIIYPNSFHDLMVQRPHHLLKQFAKNGYKAVFYNINGKSHRITEAEENYFIYDGVFPTFPKKSKRILWISYPPLYKEIGRYQEDLLVYDCIDYPGEQFAHWRKGAGELSEKADLIFVTSKSLYNFNKVHQYKALVCNNGVDFNFFTEANSKSLIRPNDLMNIKKPIIGYIGAVADWIDWNLIRYLAASNKFSIVFVGPLFGLKQIPMLPRNVHFLGRKDYSALAEYLSYFDVCIIPFRKSKLTDACNPIKMYEYLSMGKPIVTTDMEECRIDLVRYSKSYQEFYKNILESLEPQSEEEIQQRIGFAKENSWEDRVNYIRTIIEPLLDETK